MEVPAPGRRTPGPACVGGHRPRSGWPPSVMVESCSSLNSYVEVLILRTPEYEPVGENVLIEVFKLK